MGLFFYMYNYIEHILATEFNFKFDAEVLYDTPADQVFNYKILKEVELLLSPLTLKYQITLTNKEYEIRNNELFSIVFDEYPYLKQLIEKKIEDHISFEQQFYEHFNVFRNQTLKTDCFIIHKSLTLADPHNSGKTNLIIQLSDGRKWVYKTRSSQNEAQFNDFMNFIYVTKGLAPRSFAIYNFDDFSFCEYIEHESCISEAEIEEFYYRVGQQLFVLWYFNASDINHENIIACGKFPVIIDLEIISPPLKNSYKYGPAQHFSESVFSTLLLPKWTKVDGDSYANMSGLSETTESINYLYDSYMSKHMPYMNNRRRSCKAFIKVIQNGFEDTCHIFQKEEKSIREKMRHAVFINRIILHSTAYYRQLIEQLNLPENLTSVEKQKSIIKAYYSHRQSAVYHNEEKCLLERDIPIYYSLYTSKALYFKDESIPDYFESTGQEQLFSDSSKLVLENIQFQKKLIQLSIEALDPVFSHRVSVSIPSAQQDLQLAEHIYNEMNDRCIHINNSHFWLTKKHLGSGFYDVKHTGIDLLNGHTGIAFTQLLAHHLLKKPLCPFIPDLLLQDLNYIKDLISLPEMVQDKYLITHATFIEALLAFAKTTKKDVNSLITLFYETLKVVQNKTFVKIVNTHTLSGPIPDINSNQPELLIPYAISAIRYDRVEKKELLKLMVANTKSDQMQEIVFESGLSGLLFSILLSKISLHKTTASYLEH